MVAFSNRPEGSQCSSALKIRSRSPLPPHTKDNTFFLFYFKWLILWCDWSVFTLRRHWYWLRLRVVYSRCITLQLAWCLFFYTQQKKGTMTTKTFRNLTVKFLSPKTRAEGRGMGDEGVVREVKFDASISTSGGKWKVPMHKSSRTQRGPRFHPDGAGFPRWKRRVFPHPPRELDGWRFGNGRVLRSRRRATETSPLASQWIADYRRGK